MPLLIFFDDIGIPANYRQLEGFGVNTYTWITRDGKTKYVKYMLESNQGVASVIDETEAWALCNINSANATVDLYNSIKTGNFPSWNLLVQIMDPADADELDFDPLDATKIWPQTLYPYHKVGVLTLNTTVSNYFTDTEQIAFSPSAVVPGIAYSDDKLLQARLFANPDAQRYRLGSNYRLLPINAPRCPFHNNNFDGVMNFVHRTKEVNYYPSHTNDEHAAPAFAIPEDPLHGTPIREVIPKEDNYKQPRERFLSFDSDRQQRFIDRLVASLQPVDSTVRDIVIEEWSKVDDTILGPALRAAFPKHSK